MKYDLLAIDIDGTLLNSRGEVPDANRQAIQRARAAGTEVVLCTGRGLTESRTVVEQVGHHGAVILANGALISEPDSGRTLHRAVIDPHLAAGLIDVIRAEDHAALVLLDPDPCNADYLVVGHDRLTDNTRWWFENAGATVRQVDAPSTLDLHHAVRVGLVGPPHAMPPLETAVIEQYGNLVFVQHFTAIRNPGGEDVHIFEVFAEGVNKWSALQWLAADRGIDERRIAAIGDHINDLSMLRGSSCGIAMGNAVTQVAGAADRITADNDSDGLVEAIDRLLAGEW